MGKAALASWATAAAVGEVDWASLGLAPNRLVRAMMMMEEGQGTSFSWAHLGQASSWTG
jgi:hypothetical protein